MPCLALRRGRWIEAQDLPVGARRRAFLPPGRYIGQDDVTELSRVRGQRIDYHKQIERVQGCAHSRAVRRQHERVVVHDDERL